MTVYGYNATIILSDSGVTIKPGVVGNIFGGGSFLSEKHIPFTAISGVELKKGFPLIGYGHIQINTKGEVVGSEKLPNQGEAIDNNIIRFMALSNKNFEMLAREIERRMGSN